MVGRQRHVAKILNALQNKKLSFTELKDLLDLSSKTTMQKLNRLREHWFIERDPAKRGNYRITVLGRRLLEWLNSLPVEKQITRQRITQQQQELHLVLRAKQRVFRQVSYYYKNYRREPQRLYLLQFLYVLVQNMENAQTKSDLKFAYKVAHAHLTRITAHHPTSGRTELFDTVGEFANLLFLAEINKEKNGE
ncbi:MAG: winged helix-turn-helix transcriptional regulator [Candidatus Helarchaeota archaeon]